MGNSCSSPMAETIMQNLMVKTSLYWEVDSAGLRTWNIGRRPHKRCLRTLREHGLRSDHFCRLFTAQDFHYFNYVVAMDAHTYKELILCSGLNRSPKDCEVFMLGTFGKNGKLAIINDLSPAAKLKTFRSAYYQIKECCKELILSLKVNIVQYELPSSDDEEGQQEADLRNSQLSLDPLDEQSQQSFEQTTSKCHQRKLCEKCGQKFLAAL